MIHSKTLLKLLINKHNKDICVSETKTGATWYANACPRMDLWVMNRSWAHPRTICYEIKVSRSDFLQDNKWTDYLEFCSELYFVAPPGIIEPSELPPEAGLLICSVNGKRLYMKKKAAPRDVEIPESLYRYILMHRVEIIDDTVKKSKKGYWEEWLKTREIDSAFGWEVSKAIQETIKKKIEEVNDNNERLEREIDKLKEIKLILSSLGLNEQDIYSWRIKEKLENKIKEINTGISSDLIKDMENAKTSLENALKIIEKTQTQAQLKLEF